MRRLVLLLSVLVAVLPIAACGLVADDPKPEDTARAFLTAVETGDTTGAVALVDRPDEARAVIDRVRGALEPSAVRVDLDQVRDSGEGMAAASFTITWTLGEDREWSYPSSLDLRRGEDASRPWTVRWTPAIVHPELSAQQSLAVTDTPGTIAPVVDRDGAPLLSDQRVVAINVVRTETGDLAAVAGALAAQLSRIDPAITQQTITDGALKQDTYTAAVVRDADYQEMRAAIYELPGVRFVAQQRILPVDRDVAKTVLPTIRDAVSDQVTGSGGWRVVSLDAAGNELEVLHEAAPTPGTTVTTTLSLAIQGAAEKAIDEMPEQAMMVVLQPSTGEILAVAQNAPADTQGPVALMGRYPPGSTFKIASVSAALQSGLVQPTSPVPCPGTMNIDGRLIPNDGFDLGTVELHTAFARSCNTTFARLNADMSPTALGDAALQLGVGVDYVMPGATTITGSAPPGQSTVERAEAGFGQGTLLISPLGMALMTSTVASGQLQAPVLIRGAETVADRTPPAVPAAILDAIRPMMREVVTSGTARALAPYGDVHGKTGTAQFGDGVRSHGWFTGYRGDLAFAVLVVDGNSSRPAVEATARFLSGLQA